MVEQTFHKRQVAGSIPAVSTMSPEERRKKVVEIARSFIGTPYKYGAYAEESVTGNRPTGFDCSSFVQHIFKHVDTDLPRSSLLQATKGKEITNEAELLPGDLLFFEGSRGHYNHELFEGKKVYIGHVGIYTGNDKMIHAAGGSHNQVIEHKLSELPKPLYHVVMMKRIIE